MHLEQACRKELHVPGIATTLDRVVGRYDERLRLGYNEPTPMSITSRHSNGLGQ